MKSLSLQIAAVLVTLVFGIPLTFFPVRWAKAVGWTVPSDLRLVRYFGRCLGAVVLTLAGLALYASVHTVLLPTVLATTAIAMFLLSALHVVGALEKAQPPFETAEIFLYLAGGIYFGWLAFQL